ncbi:branched-chain amino acid ABC transporter substrate-binding protein [Paraburkholderia sp. Ac-20347]|jgi:branched-chain amino acid transport system substrate-binding protein|uniref:branched-chain amino acid ABC transporter substrate-binding protein n=1 Tax=Paraburkholderia sp. Ac-20347 TaxID=2703892 RepID=UPI00197FCADC|nr:branched-chain amino acid ABC transporter substrate-binding protein [Paraburkholderia sp. Ac-20347]MBN3807486.1 branched-chain amino acid ABC transporter substrate-binding protein [Paraburkholderia sp. Ac-20347]
MKKNALLLPLAALAVSAFAPGAHAQDEQVVLIGLAAPLTGASARIGKDLENGAQLAIDDANAKHPTLGGKPVLYKLVSADDQSDPRTAVTVAQQLVERHVVGVVGHWNTGCSVPAARVYHDAGIAQIAPASTGHQYTLQGFDTSFRIMGHDDDSGAYTGAYAVKTLKAQRIAVIDDQTAFGAGLANQFIKGVQANGGTVVDHQYVTDKTIDFSGVLTEIKGKRADLVFLGGIDVEAAPLVRRMRQLHIQAPLLGAGGFVSQTFLKLAGPAGEGVTALEPGRPLDRMPGGPAFDAQYRARWHAPIELHAPFAYDAAATLIAATQQVNSADPKKIVAALHSIRRDGVTGTIAFDAQGNLKDPAYTIYQVRDGKWVVVDVLGGGSSAQAAKPAVAKTAAKTAAR